jgi:hypothetical protein
MALASAIGDVDSNEPTPFGQKGRQTHHWQRRSRERGRRRPAGKFVPRAITALEMRSVTPENCQIRNGDGSRPELWRPDSSDFVALHAPQSSFMPARQLSRFADSPNFLKRHPVQLEHRSSRHHIQRSQQRRSPRRLAGEIPTNLRRW